MSELNWWEFRGFLFTWNCWNSSLQGHGDVHHHPAYALHLCNIRKVQLHKSGGILGLYHDWHAHDVVDERFDCTT